MVSATNQELGLLHEILMWDVGGKDRIGRIAGGTRYDPGVDLGGGAGRTEPPGCANTHARRGAHGYQFAYGEACVVSLLACKQVMANNRGQGKLKLRPYGGLTPAGGKSGKATGEGEKGTGKGKSKDKGYSGDSREAGDGKGKGSEKGKDNGKGKSVPARFEGYCKLCSKRTECKWNAPRQAAIVAHLRLPLGLGSAHPKPFSRAALGGWR